MELNLKHPKPNENYDCDVFCGNYTKIERAFDELESLIVSGSIHSIGKTATSGLVDIYTITMTDGNTYTFKVTNGANGKNGRDGSDANVTATNIRAALGYTPASETKVGQLEDAVNDLKENGTGGGAGATAEQLAQIEKNRTDIVNLQETVDNLGRPTDEQIDSAVTEYLNANPVSGGLTSTAKSLFITILRACATKTDQSANITALEAALVSSSGGSSGGVTTYSIINALTNVTSDNSTTMVIEGQTYTAKLTPIDGYAIETVTVTMGGSDITDAVYNDGVINIPIVTGEVLIVATAEKAVITSWLYHFDNNLYAEGEKDFGLIFNPNTNYTAVLYTEGVFGKAFSGYNCNTGTMKYIGGLYSVDLTEYPILDGDFTIAFWGRNLRNATKSTYLTTAPSNAWAYNAQTPAPNLIDTDNWTLNANSGRKPYGFCIDWVTGLRVHMADSTGAYGMCFVVTPTDASKWDTETWHHYAVTRKGSTIMLFVDGKIIWNVEFDGEIAFGNRIGLGCYWNNSGTLINGEACDLDELLIDDKNCRYSEDFEVPTAPYKG